MENLNWGPIVLLIFFVLIPLVNYFLNRLSRRFEQPASTPPPARDLGFRRQATPPSASREAERPVPPAPPPATRSPEGRRGSPRALLGTRREMRRAIIAMTLLGPCRANQPPD